VTWMAGSAAGEPESQTITFDPIADKVYGIAPFAVSATASSDLPVSLSAAGQCTVAGFTITITAAGSCTITAQQAGNANYHPAEDVIRSFAIAKAPATITIGTEYTFDGTVKAATATTNPAGLGTVTLTYSLNGSPVAQPINAGVYQVLGTLDNPNYEAPPATGTLTIRPAQPLLSWTEPAPITAGTALGSAQLNATAAGLGGIRLDGGFVYLPAAGTVLTAGTHPLSAEFFPTDGNYARAITTVTITVLPGSTLRFSGFFGAVHNLPYVNRMRAGRSVPLIFAVQGSEGRSVVQGSPTSTEVVCSGTPIEREVKETGNAETSRLRARGVWFTYVWKTDADWAGTCRSFVLTLVDGSKHEARFHFTGKPKREGGNSSGHGGSHAVKSRGRGFSH